jgi:hypothetical protein
MYQKAIDKLMKVLESLRSGEDKEIAEIYYAKNEVLERYQPIFSHEHIPQLTAEEFKSFLSFQNNKHWKAIHRQGGLITEDMETLRDALKLLLDESIPIDKRLKMIRPKNKEPMVRGLARSVITPILLVAYPKKYGVLNQVAENALKELELWPDFDRGVDFATKYTEVNKILLDISQQLGVDLWTLDTLWWRAGDVTADETDKDEAITTEQVENPLIFGLEKYLHEFLRDNWEHTEIGNEWNLYEEDGEVVGFKYRTDVGEIDLLAKHKRNNEWLVIELKRGRTSDIAVGQALRYRGWVRKRLASRNEKVKTLIIGFENDAKLLYALYGIDDIDFLVYKISFSLEKPDFDKV